MSGMTIHPKQKRAIWIVVVLALLATSPAAHAAVPVVGDPGSSTITITDEDAEIGGVWGIDHTTPPTPIGPVEIADSGSFIWPEDDLTIPLAGAIPDQEIASIPLTYDLSIANGVMNGEFFTTADKVAVVNPVTHVLSVDVLSGFRGTATAEFTGHLLGAPVAGTASCTWPTSITTLNLTTAAIHAAPYDPLTGAFKMSDPSVAVTSTPSCDYTGLNQDFRNIADAFLLDKIGFPSDFGRLDISGTFSPAPQPTTIGEITDRPVVTGPMREGQTLTCQATSAGLPAPTISYMWQRDLATISGAISSSYLVSAADAGHSLRCGAAATNVVGSGGMEMSLERSVPARCVVPRVAGLRKSRARARIIAGNCRVGRIRRVESPRPRGVVIKTRPRAGTAHPAGHRITLVIAR